MIRLRYGFVEQVEVVVSHQLEHRHSQVGHRLPVRSVQIHGIPHQIPQSHADDFEVL